MVNTVDAIRKSFVFFVFVAFFDDFSNANLSLFSFPGKWIFSLLIVAKTG